MITLSETPLDVQQIIQAATRLQAGAINAFIGTVRDNAKGKQVLRLEYEAYESMAVAEIQKIVGAAAAKWPLQAYAISHRVGVLEPGDVAVVVAVSTPHRADSFAACQYIIDTLKETVPIWKKEVLEDGEEWISAHP